MHPTSADFGRRLFSRTSAPRGGFVWVAAGVLLTALAAAAPLAPAGPWRDLALRLGRITIAVGAVGAAVACLGVRSLRRARRSEDYYEDGACRGRGGRRQWLAYADAERVMYVVRSAAGRVERSISFTGPGGNPEWHLSTDAPEGQNVVDGAAGFADVQNVASRVVKAAASRMVERVDRGEVVKWTDRLWLDQAGLRLDDPAGAAIIPWGAIDGVKDGNQSGRIEVYAFGAGDPAAAAMTYDVNGLPGFQAFMHLLDRAQAATRAA